MQKFCKVLLQMMKYNIDYVNIPAEKKYVIVFAPHTSWKDFAVGKIALTAMGVKTTFLIKKEMFFFPIGPLLKSIGGFPVDRKQAKSLTTIIANYLKEQEQMAILVSPEGTRKLVTTWKRGFYHIAQKAEVPIALGYLDYTSRKGGIGGIYYPTGNYDIDLLEIQKFYYGMRGRIKGKFHLENYEL